MMSGAGESPMAGTDRRSGSGGSSRNRGGNPFSWTALSPSPVEIDALERHFPEIIQLPTAVIDREAAAWSSSGLIIRTLSRWVPSEAVIREFRRAGLGGRIEAIPLAHRSSLLRFELPEARGAALKQPWVVNGQPLAMEEWRPNFIPAADAVRFALLWIRLPNLPLEFWSEDTLRSILSAAGEFVAVDAFTKERRRGSFARACVRIDLSKPLRPGARVRAHGAPFWQQFAFENVDCICSSCGSVHLAGPCSSSSDPKVSDTVPCYGPWMAALRRRKPVPAAEAPAMIFSASSSGKSPQRAEVLEGGWMVPGKTSRRKSLQFQSGSNVAIVHVNSPSTGIQDEVPPCRLEPCVPVTVAEGVVFGSSSGAPSGSSPNPGSSVFAKKKPKGGKKSIASALISHPIDKMQKKHPGVSLSSAMVQGVVAGPKESFSRGKSGPLLLTYNSRDSTPASLAGSARPAGCSQSSGDANPASLKRARAGEGLEPMVRDKVSSDTAMTIARSDPSLGLRDAGSPSLYWSKIGSVDLALPVEQPDQGDSLLPDQGSPLQCLDLVKPSDLSMGGV